MLAFWTIAGRGAAGLAALSTLALCTAASAGPAGPTRVADPLKAVIFAGQDAVIDLGPIVPTPTVTTRSPPAATPQAAPPPPAGTPRFTVTRVRADGVRETRAIDSAELQSLGQAAPPPLPKPAPAERRQPRTIAAVVRAAAPPPAPRLLGSGWKTAALAPQAAEIDEAADAVSPLVVTGKADATPRKRSRDKTTLGVRDGRTYGEKGRFYVFAGGRGGGIGWNVVNHGDAWGGDGVSWDRNGFVGQRSAGIGWRKGDVTTSLGWAHEKNRIRGFFGFPSEKDERVALNLTWRPSPK